MVKALFAAACFCFVTTSCHHLNAQVSHPGGGGAGTSNDTFLKLARKYAPDLWFHQDDKHRPTSALFFVKDNVTRSLTNISECTPGFVSEECFDAIYTRLPLEEKRHVVFYWVRNLSDPEAGELAKLSRQSYRKGNGDPRLEDIRERHSLFLIQYWFYYPRNHYEIRPFLAAGHPFRQTHKHDLEHVFLVVYEPNRFSGAIQLSTDPVIIAVGASAHEQGPAI